MISRHEYGHLSDGRCITQFNISNEKMSFSAVDYGCIITEIKVPGKCGTPVDVLLGFSDIGGYEADTACHNAIIGRFANRIGNAEFSVDGKSYKLDRNDGQNCLHGGFVRYEKMLWNSEVFEKADESGVIFTRVSPDGEQGFPGNLRISVRYSLNSHNEIHLEYKAETDRATPVNITNHAYFNLSGGGTVLDEFLELKCSSYLEIDDSLIPTGRICPVEGTPFDFLNQKQIGKDINRLGTIGYDHCFVTEAFDSKKIVTAAVLKDSSTGITLTVSTDQAGLQVYTGNYLDGIIGKNNIMHKRYDGICFESECFPDSPNREGFTDCILRPGQVYSSNTVWKFDFPL